VLVNRDLTLLCGAYEAVAVGKPLITSDWPVLRNYFSSGTLYVDNTPESIRDGVQRVAQGREQLSREMQQLKHSLDRNWTERFDVLRTRVERALEVADGQGVEARVDINPDGANAPANRTPARNL